MTNPHTCSEDVQKAVSIALHQIRTRALRDAPVYLQHVSMAEKELQHSIMQLITRYGDQREVKGLNDLMLPGKRLDEYGYSPDENAVGFNSAIQLVENRVKHRVEELKAKEVKGE